jgi:hypothetical protein
MVTATVLALVLANPVGGDVIGRFELAANPFQGGQHRGIDLEAAPGADVAAACSGRVVVAGRVGSSGRLVTVRCGRWRVTHMPMAHIAVRAGELIARGTRLGAVGASEDHTGLHLGVRREGHRFGYVDPLRFFSNAPFPPPASRPPTVNTRPPPTRRTAPHEEPRPLTRPVPVATAAPRTHPAPRAAPAPANLEPRAAPPPANLAPRSAPAPANLAPRAAPVRSPSSPLGSDARARARAARSGGLAPWTAWAGLALVLAGAGVRIRGRVGGRRRWSRVVLRRPVR